MVMPDCSLVVTIFSRHSWLLQRTATSVTSMVTFSMRTVSSVHAEFMPPLVRTVILRVPETSFEARRHLNLSPDKRTIALSQFAFGLADRSSALHQFGRAAPFADQLHFVLSAMKIAGEFVGGLAGEFV